MRYDSAISGDPRRCLGPARRTPRKLRTAIVAISTTNNSGPTASRAPRVLRAASSMRRSRQATATTKPKTPRAGLYLPSRTATVEANTTSDTENVVTAGFKRVPSVGSLGIGGVSDDGQYQGDHGRGQGAEGH